MKRNGYERINIGGKVTFKRHLASVARVSKLKKKKTMLLYIMIYVWTSFMQFFLTSGAVVAWGLLAKSFMQKLQRIYNYFKELE